MSMSRRHRQKNLTKRKLLGMEFLVVHNALFASAAERRRFQKTLWPDATPVNITMASYSCLLLSAKHDDGVMEVVWVTLWRKTSMSIVI